MIQINDSNIGNILLIELTVLLSIYLLTYPFVKKWYKKKGKSLKDLALKFGYPFILLSSFPFWLVRNKTFSFWSRLALFLVFYVIVPIIYYFTLHPLIKSGRKSFRKSMGWRQCEEDMDDNDEKKIDNK